MLSRPEIAQVVMSISPRYNRDGTIDAEMLFDVWDRMLHQLQRTIEQLNITPVSRPEFELLPVTGDVLRMRIFVYGELLYEPIQISPMTNMIW